MGMLHQWYLILLSPCQQLWFWCVPVYGRFVQRNPIESLQCHFLAPRQMCVYTTWLQLEVKLDVFCTSPKEQPHQLYHVAIGGTVSVRTFYIQQPHNCFLSFSTKSTSGLNTQFLNFAAYVICSKCAKLNSAKIIEVGSIAKICSAFFCASLSVEQLYSNY